MVLKAVDVVAGEERPVTLAAPEPASAGSIAGRVAPPGPGGVAAIGESYIAGVACADDGTFLLEGLPAGSYRVVAAPKTASPDSPALPAEGGVLVDVQPGGSVSVVVSSGR